MSGTPRKPSASESAAMATGAATKPAEGEWTDTGVSTSRLPNAPHTKRAE